MTVAGNNEARLPPAGTVNRRVRGPRQSRGVHPLLWVWNAVVMALLVLPVVVVIPMSFTEEKTFSFPPQGFSLRWYENFFTSPKWLDSLVASLQVGLGSALLATILGTLAAIALQRMWPRVSGMIQSLFLAPMIVPAILIAVALYSVFLRWQIVGSIEGFIAAHTILGLPFVIVSVTASLSGYDRSLETAAASLGAPPWRIMTGITLPLIMPGVISGFVLAFVTSFDESVVSLFLQTPDLRTLPVNMFDAIATEIDPTVAAASSLIVVVTTAIVVGMQVAILRRKK